MSFINNVAAVRTPTASQERLNNPTFQQPQQQQQQQERTNSTGNLNHSNQLITSPRSGHRNNNNGSNRTPHPHHNNNHNNHNNNNNNHNNNNSHHHNHSRGGNNANRNNGHSYNNAQNHNNNQNHLLQYYHHPNGALLNHQSPQISGVPVTIAAPTDTDGVMYGANANYSIPAVTLPQQVNIHYHMTPYHRGNNTHFVPHSSVAREPIGGSNSAQGRSKSVCRLTCMHCISIVCIRGMKAILLADTRTELYSTDIPPQGVELVFEDYMTSHCRCKIRDVACLGCGNVIGYHVTQPCDTCLDSCNNGHFWMFHAHSVTSTDRLDSNGYKPLMWAHLPKHESMHNINSNVIESSVYLR